MEKIKEIFNIVCVEEELVYCWCCWCVCNLCWGCVAECLHHCSTWLHQRQERLSWDQETGEQWVSVGPELVWWWPLVTPLTLPPITHHPDTITDPWPAAEPRSQHLSSPPATPRSLAQCPVQPPGPQTLWPGDSPLVTVSPMLQSLTSCTS